ncbi:MAG: winged helix-turn-helix transcriptional regulator [Gemmatimonadetes bacterium]|nr:winged helix-turn-helix transcriptional regulator [Gemmatimonadota bacterium]
MPVRRTFDPAYVALAARWLGLLSHETRLHLVLSLAQGPGTVSELCAHHGLPQSNCSHHLGILRNAGLVVDERDGQFVNYRLNVEVWRRIGDGFFDQLLAGADVATLQHVRIERNPRGR